MPLPPGQDAGFAALLDNLFRNASAVFYLAQANDGRALTYVSPNIATMLGYPPRSFLADPSFWREHLHPEDVAHAAPGFDRLRESGAVVEYRLRDAQGAYRWISDEIELVKADQGAPAFVRGYWRDISEQKTREADLLETAGRLRHQADSLQSVLDSLPQRLLWKDRDSVFRGCNQAAASAVGLARTEEIIGKTDFDLHADRMEADYLRLHDEVVMKTGQATYHADVPAGAGDTWLDVTKVPLRGAGGAVGGLLICYEDVSERKRNELALRNFRRAVEQSSSAICITNIEGDIEYANPRFLQLFGYSENEVLGKNPRLLKSDTNSANHFHELWQTILGGESWRGEFLNRTKSGEEHWIAASISPIFEDNGEITHFLAIEDDITERKALEARLQRQLAFTQTLTNALPHPIYFKSRDGIYRGCNRAFEEFVGLDERDFVGKTVFEIFPPELARKYHEMDNELFANPGLQSYETKLRHRDGSLHEILSHKATFTNEHGEVAGIIGAIFDISDLKRIEEELRQSEERFRTIANYTYNWENWVAPDGRLLWVNPAVERITGYTPAECHAMPNYPAPLIHPEDWPEVAGHYAASLRGAPHRDLEFRILRKDGAVRWVEVAVQQVQDGSGKNLGHRSSLRDVTDRRQAMDDLHDTRGMLQLVLDHIPQGVFWKGIDGKYLGGNAVFARDIGMKSGDEARGLSDLDLFPAAEARKFIRDDAKVIRSGQPLTSTEEQFTDYSGSKHWVLSCKVPLYNQRGEIFSLLGTYTDLTELKQMDAELRESEARLREITSTAAEGIYVMEADGTLNFVNPEAARLLGMDASELLGQPGRTMFRPPNQPEANGDEFPCKIIEATRAGKQFCSDEELFYRKDGTSFNVAIRATPISREGEYAGSVVAFHDITEQNLMQRHLEDALQQLQAVNASLEQRVSEQTRQNLEKERLLIQQSRSAAMGDMISNIAHQWRQPLSTLGLVVQNILLDYQDNQLSGEDLEQYVTTAQQSIVHMSETIDDFRDFFRPDKEKAMFSLHKAIEESLRLLQATLKHNRIEIAMTGDRSLQAFGHFNEFSQVILNLIANAKDALVGNKVAHGKIEIELAKAGGMGNVVIRDNAGGIALEAIAKIFDPYFTTKAGGTGIGLYMSKTIIEKHMSGNIDCRNTADGAEFTVSIPLGAGNEAG